MYKNAEGYSDPTPGEAMSNIRKEQRQQEAAERLALISRLIPVMKQTAAETRAAIQSGASEKEMFDYAELVREKWQEKIGKYLDENGYDRTALEQMIAAVRSGNISSFQAMA